ncbi:hypothetical protein AAT19DRAFT_10675 [Rhodotorula toruloides]|uniref:ATPase inhibitor, mitochondrial n=1 Tax=Rhodotorula toruloides TaxID=5286 RepID=A0A2S9ZZF3_RHOTO|nr:hypothetical protein AAT19DRAFT_10675 [Rhodotorula toruloides]
MAGLGKGGAGVGVCEECRDAVYAARRRVDGRAGTGRGRRESKVRLRSLAERTRLLVETLPSLLSRLERADPYYARLQQGQPTKPLLASLVARSSEGMPSGHSQSSFNKREKAQEEAYVRDAEREKLKALRKSIEASKAHLEELESQHKDLEASIKSGEKAAPQ